MVRALTAREVQIAQASAVPAIQASSRAFGGQISTATADAVDGFGRGLQSLGQVVGALALKRQAQEDETASDRLALEYDLWASNMNREEQGRAREAGAGFYNTVQGRLEKETPDFLQRKEQELGFRLSDRGRKQFENRILRTQYSHLKRAAAFENNERIAHLKNTVSDQIALTVKSVTQGNDVSNAFARAKQTLTTNGTLYSKEERAQLAGGFVTTVTREAVNAQPADAPQSHLEGILATVQDNIAKMPGLKPSERESLINQAQGEVTAGVIERQIRTNPVQALRNLKNDTVWLSLGRRAAPLQMKAEMALANGTELSRRQRKEQADAATKDGIDLLSEGKMTAEWLEQNRNILPVSTYKNFVEGLRGGGDRTTDSTIYRNLVERLTTDPSGVMQEASEAHGRGLLKDSDFKTLYTRARDFNSLDKRPRWHNNIRDSVRFGLMPNEFDISGKQARAQQEALLDFDEWALENPTATFKEARDRAAELVEEVRDGKRAQELSNLALPRGISKSSEHVTMDDLVAAKQDAARAFQSGELSREELLKQGRLIQRWMSHINKK